MRLALISAALVLIGGQVRAESVDVRGWKVEKSGDKASGESCTLLSVSDDNKGGFILGVNSGNLAFIGLVDTDLKMTPGASFQASYHIDSTSPAKIMGQAASATTYILPLGDWKSVQSFFNAASAGNSISIDVGGESYEYSLNGSKDAIASFDQCAVAIGLPAPN